MASGGNFNRKTTAIGTVGGVGQGFTVFENNWVCTQCKADNLARRTRCHRCKAKKPEGGGGYVMDPAFEKVMNGETIKWREILDPASRHVYYHNTETGETRWDRPAELGSAPFATGWFGRGSTHKFAKPASFYVERNTRWLARPSKKQKEHITAGRGVLEGANEYNVWYDKYVGDHWNYKRGKDPAESRCDTATHAGATKADKMDRSSRYFCLHFVRGMCAKGAECTYFHRTPMPIDDGVEDQLRDCFGRERHEGHRDDMDGVGSFKSPSRTLYVGGLVKSSYDTPEALEKALWIHFGEWGEVEHINVIYRLSIAFVRFRMRCGAEFAKEAMANQRLDAKEVLNIRWAFDDPNPVAKEAIERSDWDATLGLLEAKGIDVYGAQQAGSAHIEHPENYQMPAPKRQRLEDGAAAYPDTDSQYGTAAAGTGASASASASAWQTHVDPNTGSSYYHNQTTGETRWTLPEEPAKPPPASDNAASSSASSGEHAEAEGPGASEAAAPPADPAYTASNGMYAYNAWGYTAEAEVAAGAQPQEESEEQEAD